MNPGQALLEVQKLDLMISRTDSELLAMPELKEIARKRQTLKRLKAEARSLMLKRNDLEIDIDDLGIDRQNTETDVERAQAEAQDADHRRVADLEMRLSQLAKKLDKIEHAVQAKQRDLDDVNEKRAKLDDYISRFEASIIADADAARSKAEGIRAEAAKARRRREKLAGEVDVELLGAYEDIVDSFGGLAVEELKGTVPSICRTALSEASMSDIARMGAIAYCPNCHRILIRDGVGA